MKTLVETITPKKAKDLLEKNTHNRPVSNKRVDHYASLMKAGKWHLSHQGIAISKTDVIIDGQHRLLAVVQANMPIDFSITYGVEDETFKFVDVGYTRTTSNIFAIEGIQNYTRHAAGVSRYHDFKRSSLSLSSSSASARTENHYTHDDYLQFYYDNEQLLINIHSKVSSWYGRYKILKTSEMYAFFVYGIIDGKWSFKKLESFFDHVFMLRHDSVSNVPRLLFDKLIRDATGATQMKPKARTAILIKAFNYFVAGKSLERLHFVEGNESFPDVKINNH